ncbi:hypothetical protein WA158_004763 [Blastocystis sp. Blastoise]
MVELELIDTLEGHNSEVWYASWCPTRDEIASCGSDRTIRIWKKVDGKWILYSTLVGEHKKTVRCVEYSPDGKSLASCSFDSTIIIWKYDGKTFKYSHTLEGHSSEVKHVDWKPSGDLLASCSRDRNIMIWGYEDEDSEQMDCYNMLLGHTQDIKFVKWHPTLNRLYSCSYDNTIKIWEEEGYEYVCKHNLTVHKNTIWGITFINPDENEDSFVSVDGSGNIVLWRKDGDDYLGLLYSGYTNFALYSVDYNQQYLITGGEENKVYLFTKKENELQFIQSQQLHEFDINCLRWNIHDDHNIFLSCSDDRTIKLWKVKN